MKNPTRIRYDKVTVDQAIAASGRHGRNIDTREARQIHRLLSGRHEPNPQPSPLAQNSEGGAGGRAAMSRERFQAGLLALGYNISTAHQLLGIGRSTIYRMADGTAKVPQVIARLMDMYERFGIPEEHKS